MIEETPSTSSPPKLPIQSAIAKVGAPWGFWATLGFSLIIFGVPSLTASIVLAGLIIVGGITVHGFSPGALESNGFVLGLSSVCTMPFIIGLCWLFAWARRRISIRDYLALKPVRRRTLLGWSAWLLAYLVVSDRITSWTGHPIVPEVMLLTYRSAGFLPLLWFAVVIAAPLSEELLFRGFMFKGILHSPLGPGGAIVLTSLLWGTLHIQYDVFGIANIVCGGFLLGYARWKTGSIYPTILMHTLMNLVATIEVVIMIMK